LESTGFKLDAVYIWRGLWLALWFEFGIVSPTPRHLQQSGGIPTVNLVCLFDVKIIVDIQSL
jgi:hypothetical protein